MHDRDVLGEFGLEERVSDAKLGDVALEDIGIAVIKETYNNLGCYVDEEAGDQRRRRRSRRRRRGLQGLRNRRWTKFKDTIVPAPRGLEPNTINLPPRQQENCYYNGDRDTFYPNLKSYVLELVDGQNRLTFLRLEGASL